MSIKGRIHSLESFGTVDGPGIRFVVFMQGCPLRCLYCHNPDTWETKGKVNYEMTPEELINEILRYKNFITNGGVTVSGGEPLMQAEFVTSFFKLCQEARIHTALDTTGFIYTPKTIALLQYTNLVLLDIKTISPELHIALTGVKHNNTLRFLNKIEEYNIPVWIRHVVVPGITNDKISLQTLAKYISQYKVIEKAEILPYHTMGSYKYKELGMKYPLEDTPPLSIEELNIAKKIFRKNGIPCE